MSRLRMRASAAVLGWGFGTMAPAWSATIVVPDDRPTIGDAVARASPHDTIQVRPGTYAESVLVRGDTKSGLTLEGLGDRPLVTPPDGAEGIHIEGARHVIVHHLAVAGGAIGVHVLDSAEAVVRDVRVVGSGEGIRVRRCRTGCEVRESTVEGTTRGPGIRILDSPGAMVSDNVVTASHRDGIRVVRSDQLSFADNRVEQCGSDGIRITRCDFVQELEGNVASGNRGTGVLLDRGFVDGSCPACGVEENSAKGNGRYGVRVRRWARIATPSDLSALENSSASNRKADFSVRPP